MSKVFYSENSQFPRVKITDAAMKAVGGEVSVDLEGINQLLRTDLGLEEPITPKYVLYGRRKNSPLLGLHVPYSHTAYVQLPTSYENDFTAVPTLIHESVHLVDSVQHPVRTAGELALRGLAHVASVRLARETAELLPGPELTDLFARSLTYWGLRMELYYRRLDPSENRARRRQNDEALLDKYHGVITIGRGSKHFFFW